MLKVFNGKEIYDAFVKNGLAQIREQYVEVDENGNVIAGCLLTQAAVNLKALSTTDGAFESSNGSATPTDNFDDVNTLQEQLNRFRVPSTSKWYVSRVVSDDNRLGDAIIHWYDMKVGEENCAICGRLKKEDTKWDSMSQSHLECQGKEDVEYHWEDQAYFLDTYEESLAMVKDILEPHFRDLFYLEVREQGWTFSL